MYWESPYINEGIWLRGNTHTHTTVSDGGHSPMETALLYGKVASTGRSPNMDYRFLVLTDHTINTKPELFELPQVEGLTVIEGLEYSYRGGSHIVGVGCPMVFDGPVEWYDYTRKDYQRFIDSIVENGGMAILAHPHWSRMDHWSAEDAIELNGYMGIEIISGDVFSGPSNLATDVWDAALTAGKRVWGIGSDDFHSTRDFHNAWTFVYARDDSKEAILDALRQGSSYTSNGASFGKLYADGKWIVAECADDSYYHDCEKTFRFIGEGGVLKQTQVGKNHTAVYKGRGDEMYIRVELTLNWGCSAFSQPFFRV